MNYSCNPRYHVFVFNGDTYLDIEAQCIEKHWQIHRAPIIVAREVDDTTRYGRLNTIDGRIAGFSEKGIAGPGLINAGGYVFPASILDEFPLGKPFSLETDFLSKAVGMHRIDFFVTHGHFIDIGIPEDYAKAQVELVWVCTDR